MNLIATISVAASADVTATTDTGTGDRVRSLWPVMVMPSILDTDRSMGKVGTPRGGSSGRSGAADESAGVGRTKAWVWLIGPTERFEPATATVP